MITCVKLNYYISSKLFLAVRVCSGTSLPLDEAAWKAHSSKDKDRAPVTQYGH